MELLFRWPTALLGERREVGGTSVRNALAGNLGARPKGRPQYIPQWALSEGMPAYPPPPVDRALPAWAVTSHTTKPTAPPSARSDSSAALVAAQPTVSPKVRSDKLRCAAATASRETLGAESIGSASVKVGGSSSVKPGESVVKDTKRAVGAEPTGSASVKIHGPSVEPGVSAVQDTKRTFGAESAGSASLKIIPLLSLADLMYCYPSGRQLL